MLRQAAAAVKEPLTRTKQQCSTSTEPMPAVQPQMGAAAAVLVQRTGQGMQTRAEITQILHLEPSFARIPKTSPGQAAGGLTRTTALTAASAAFQTADRAACVGIQMQIRQVHQIIGDCQPAHSTQALSGTAHQRMLQQPAVLLTAVKCVLDRTAWDLPPKSSSSLMLMSQVHRLGRMLPVCNEHLADQSTCPGHGELA